MRLVGLGPEGEGYAGPGISRDVLPLARQTGVIVQQQHHGNMVRVQ